MRPIRMMGRRHRGPMPVPELDAAPTKERTRFPILLGLRTGVIALVVVIGVASSGFAATHATGPPVAKSANDKGRHHQPSTAVTHPSTTTAAPAPTSAQPASSPATGGSGNANQATSMTSSTGPGSTTTTAVAPSSPIIQASGTQLYLYGAPYRFVGVNAYEAATDWGTNAGCGADLSDGQLDQLFASLPANSLVRFWAFQGTMATNVNTHQLDWGPLDRVFAAAAAHGQRLIVTLTDQGGTCDGGHWQDPSWYQSGFKTVFNDPATTDGRGLTPLSYWTYLQDIVTRYAASPALGMWEPISEAEASTCPPAYQPTNCSGHQQCLDEAAAASALRFFFDTVGAEIHTLDPKHLVESGLLGGGQCGTQGSDYQYVSASPGIDVLSYHDYWGTTPIGGDQWNGMAVRFRQSVAIGKPIIAGEVGLQAGTAPGCLSTTTRNADFVAKEQAQGQAGSSGMLLWNWVPSPTDTCSYDVIPSDPLLQAGGAIG